MRKVNVKEAEKLLKHFTKNKKKKVTVMLTGALALQYYGLYRGTVDVDAEASKDSVEELIDFLSMRNVPSDISSDISRWSVISLPKGYRRRAKIIYDNKTLRLTVIHPLDFVVSKLRRGTEEDLRDALYLVERFSLTGEQILRMCESAIKNSPRDTMVLTFRRNVLEFVKNIKPGN